VEVFQVEATLVRVRISTMPSRLDGSATEALVEGRVPPVKPQADEEECAD